MPTRSSYLDNAVVPAALLVTESMWSSALLFALLHAFAKGLRDDVPALALALPGLLIILSAALVGRARTDVHLAPVLLFVPCWILGAIAYDSTVLGGAPGDVLAPWSVAPTAANQANLALVVCGIAALRGAFLARRTVTFTAARASTAIGGSIFAILLLIAAMGHGPFNATLSDSTPVLFLVAVPVGFAALALARAGDLERDSSAQKPSTRQFVTYVSMLLPLGVIATVALGCAAIAAVVAPSLFHGGSSAAEAIGRLFGHLFAALHLHVPHVAFHPRSNVKFPFGHPAPVNHQKGPHTAKPFHPISLFIPVVSVAGAAGALIIAAVLWKAFHPPRHDAADDLTEDKESVFSFRHLLDQLRVLRGSDGEGGTAPLAADERPALATVRGQYLRLLEQARQIGRGRGTGETPIELAARLSSEPGQVELAELTELYDAVRYGMVVPAPGDAARASELVDRAISTIDEDDRARPSTGRRRA